MAQNGSASILASALKPIAAGSSQMQVTREPGATASGSGSNNAASSAGPSRGRLAVRGRGRGVAEEDVNMSDSSTGSRGGRKGKRGSAARRSGGPGYSKEDRPYERDSRGPRGRNTPAVISDGKRRGGQDAARQSEKRPEASAGAIETLRLFVQQRYDPQSGLLNLENMATDATFKQNNLKAPGEKGAPTNLAAALWKLAGEMFPQVQSISLANNGLTSLTHLAPFELTTRFANLQNLSLAQNKLRRISHLDPLSAAVGKSDGRGLKHLRELILIGNPLAANGAGEDVYRREVAKRFPSLSQLDQKPIDTSIAFQSRQTGRNTPIEPGISPRARKDAAAARNKARMPVDPSPPIPMPVQVAGSYCDSDTTREFVSQFFLKFFESFDGDRSTLAPLFTDESVFSYSLDMVMAKRSAEVNRKLPNQTKLRWTAYLEPGGVRDGSGSRNLLHLKKHHQARQEATLHKGATRIMTSYQKLPMTRHPIAEPGKFVFDAWQMEGLLAPPAPGAPPATAMFATVHGQFTELPINGVRSFDRTFILAPAPPGSAAAVAGWPCVIVSDMLTLRVHSDPSAWQPEAPAVAAHAPSGSERAPGISDEQQTLVVQLQGATRLTYQFALMCLEQNGWDAQTAFANFQSLNAQGAIPAEGFVPQ